MLTKPLSRACLHDPAVFPDPEVFRPERFIRDGKLDVGLRDPTAFVFGYGRRFGKFTFNNFLCITNSVYAGYAQADTLR